jgi:hypothetical protein
MPKLKYEDRLKRYEGSSFLPTTFEIHWLAMINSMVLVMLLTAFLTIILMRILKKDFSRYMEVDEDEIAEEETGWKMINGDVFRSPENLSLFAALVGSGGQIFVASFVLLVCVISGAFKATKRGALLTAAIMIYAVCGIVGGMISGRLYKQLKGTQWVWNTITTALIFPFPLAIVFSWVNSVAYVQESTAALPFTTILVYN